MCEGDFYCSFPIPKISVYFVSVFLNKLYRRLRVQSMTFLIFICRSIFLFPRVSSLSVRWLSSIHCNRRGVNPRYICTIFFWFRTKYSCLLILSFAFRRHLSLWQLRLRFLLSHFRHLFRVLLDFGIFVVFPFNILHSTQNQRATQSRSLLNEVVGGACSLTVVCVIYILHLVPFFWLINHVFYLFLTINVWYFILTFFY